MKTNIAVFLLFFIIGWFIFPTLTDKPNTDSHLQDISIPPAILINEVESCTGDKVVVKITDEDKNDVFLFKCINTKQRT